MYQRILVPVDGRVPSRSALQHALTLGRSSDAELRLAHVVAWPGWFLDLGESPEIVYDNLTRAGQSILEEAIDSARRSGVRASATLLDISGSGVSRAIVEEATRWPADLIVMGTRGGRGLARLLFGSVVDGVIRTTPVPVLVIRASRRADPVIVSPLGARWRSETEPEVADPGVPRRAA
jgi:nucleotide-binding universal stress UspA family protein